jgi:hypothetical protein
METFMVGFNSYGAEFTCAYADHFTGRVPPTDIALKSVDKKNEKDAEKQDVKFDDDQELIGS